VLLLLLERKHGKNYIDEDGFPTSTFGNKAKTSKGYGHGEISKRKLLESEDERALKRARQEDGPRRVPSMPTRFCRRTRATFGGALIGSPSFAHCCTSSTAVFIAIFTR